MPEIFIVDIDTPQGKIPFKFEQLQAMKEALYIVSCTYGGEAYCFHLMYDMDEAGAFKIIDPHNCPADIENADDVFSKAIEHHYL